MKISFKSCAIFFAFAIACCFYLSPTAHASDYHTDFVTTENLIELIANDLNVPADLDSMADLGIFSDAQVACLQNHPDYIRKCEAWFILLPVYEVYPYPALSYPELMTSENHSKYNPYLDAQIAASLIGLTTPTPTLDFEYISKTTLINAIEKLKTGDFTSLTLPTTLESFSDYIDDSIAWTINSYEDRNASLRMFFLVTKIVPEIWVQDFQDEEWTLEYGIPEEYDPDNRYSGLTAYVPKAIYIKICSDDVLIHEFTHFATRNYSEKSLNRYYEEGTSALQDILRKYAWTNAYEYIAVFMEVWLTQPDRQAELIDLAPETSGFAKSLIDNYFDLVR